MPSKRPKPTIRQETLAIYSDPHVYRWAEEASRLLGRGPSHPGYGRDLTMCLMDLEARVHGNRLSCERANRDVEMWKLKRRRVEKVTGKDLLLPTPPREAQVRRWRNELVPLPQESPTDAASDGFYETLPQNLSALNSLFTQLGAARARTLGHFEAGVRHDFTHPRRKHMVIPDGSYLSPHSFARVWTDPNGTEHCLGSRAKTAKGVRQQAYLGGETKDGRKYMGVNHVVAITPTKYGRVALGVERALHGEPIAAVDLIDRIVDWLGDGVHAVLYDKGLQDWAQEHLLAKYGILPMVPPIRKSAKDSEVTHLRLDAEDQIRRTLPPAKKARGKKGTRKSRRPLSEELPKAMAHHAMAKKYDVTKLAKLFKKGHAIGAGLRVGQSQYVSSQGKVVQTESQHFAYGDYTHRLPDGTACQHLLHVDDTALWEVAPMPLGTVKTQRLRVESAYPERDGDQFHLVINHQLICHEAGELCPISTRFTPRLDRGPHGSRRTGLDMARARLRPLAPCEIGFRKAYGKRSEVESWFEFMKQRLLDGKRAASLDVNHQFLDVLYVGLISNALALRNFRLEKA